MKKEGGGDKEDKGLLLLNVIVLDVSSIATLTFYECIVRYLVHRCYYRRLCLQARKLGENNKRSKEWHPRKAEYVRK